MYRKLIPAAAAVLAFGSVAAIAAPANSSQTASSTAQPAQKSSPRAMNTPANTQANTQANAKSDAQQKSQVTKTAAHRTAHHRSMIHHASMTRNDDRETSALNRLEVAGYTSFKDMKMQGQNIVVDASKGGGKFQELQVNPSGSITPST